MAKAIPAFTYTGTSSTSADNNYWYIYLKTSGNFTFTKASHTIDVFLVGGGGGGGGGYYRSSGNVQNGGGGGGGGGYCETFNGISASSGISYPIVIGAGGTKGASVDSSTATTASPGGDGSASTAFGKSASGGKGGTAGNYDPSGGYNYTGGNGGNGGPGGTNGSDGQKGEESEWSDNAYNGTPGVGSKKSTTFNGVRYSDGGYGGGGIKGAIGTGTSEPANTGNGGVGGFITKSLGDTFNRPANSGGSGIVILRGSDTDLLPVYYNDKQLETLEFQQGSGQAVQIHELYYNNQKIF